MKKLLRKLIQAQPTAQKGELSAAKIISAEFAASGIASTIDVWNKNRANITAVVKSSANKAALLFVCHLDVVGPGREKWKYPPFKAVQSEGKIHGRGSADMKGGITAIVTAIKQLVDSGVRLNGDIIFFAAAGEESDSCGAKRFVRSFDGLDNLAAVIIPEPTDFEVVTAHRGALWLKITTIGKTAHGSTPQLGINAIASMQAVLNQLENYEIQFEPHKSLGKCSMSINTITGGQTINVVPDRCSIGIDIRTLPGQDHKKITSDFEKMFTKLKEKNPQFDAELSIIREVNALETDPSCDFVKDFCSVIKSDKTKAVSFTTDAPHFTSLGVPIVIYGPGKSQLCHKANEYIDIADVEKAIEHYKKIILKFLS